MSQGNCFDCFRGVFSVPSSRRVNKIDAGIAGETLSSSLMILFHQTCLSFIIQTMIPDFPGCTPSRPKYCTAHFPRGRPTFRQMAARACRMTKCRVSDKKGSTVDGPLSLNLNCLLVPVWLYLARVRKTLTGRGCHLVDRANRSFIKQEKCSFELGSIVRSSLFFLFILSRD